METEETGQGELIAEKLAQVQRRIREAAQSAGRSGDEIQIVAVTKGHSASTIRTAALSGLSSFGENYIQEALAKQGELADVAGLSWHFIGHLQSNKAALAAGRFALIQGIDSERLARKVAEASSKGNITQSVLVQVHLGDEKTKFGTAPEDALAICEKVARFENLSLQGLMGIAPADRPDPRPYFAQLRDLFERLPIENRRILSMGMSGDYEAAIQEGATMVRIGTAILGQRGG